MDVRCSRCSTEYEFDDALISERGTTVKCTNCGFQFKIFPADAAGLAPDRWVVRTAAGRELVYTSLRELQRGIADKQVSARDLLSRGKQAPRALSSIAELEPFFQGENARPSADHERSMHTLQGVAPRMSSPYASQAPPSTFTQGAALAPPSAPMPEAEFAPQPVTERMPESFGARQLSHESPRPPSSSRLSAFDSTLESPGLRAPVSSPRNLPPIEVASIRDAFKSYDELHDPALDSRHAHVARSRWIAAVVLVGLLGLLASTVGRRYIAKLSGASHVDASSDARVATFLSEGNRALDEGDFEGAKEQFDKATALAEKDPAVLTALARLETLRADLWWLKLRLEDPTSTELVQATYRELGRRVGKARSAVDRAFAVSPEDPAVLRARVDAMRLSGDSDKAREWLAPLSANPGVPENAYVLAALDLAEPAPPWPSVIDRLHTAAAAEQDPGRARAALIYALARAGRNGEAQSEFDKIDGRPKPHPLLEELRAFLQRANRAPAPGTDASVKGGTLDPTKLPKLDTSPGKLEAAPAKENLGDFRARLSTANNALHRGELARAEQLFNAVIEEQPANTEALAGLAEVAKARNDPDRAASLYQRVLDTNPSYLPALLASADQKWDAGDRAGAVSLYRKLLEQAGPDSVYGARASARLARANGNGSDGTSASSPAETRTAQPEPPPTTTPPAAIDTTDLPGDQ